MRLDELRAPSGARHTRKRVGRGNGSAGTYSGRGMKGQKARSGGGVRPSFEGGQNPMVKRLPEARGFTNIFKKYYSTVNVEALSDRFPEGSEITPQDLREARLVRGLRLPIKILGNGEIDHSIVISAHKFSLEARRKIEAAGGRVLEIDT